MTQQRITLLMVRPFKQSVEFATAFLAHTGLDIAIVPSPVLDTEPIGALPDCDAASALVFTSANAVAVYAAQNPDRRLRSYCVGATTAKAATAAGFRAISAEGDLAQLLELLTATHMEGDGHYVYLRGQEVSGDLTGLLEARGVPVQEAVIYRQVEKPLSPKAKELLANRRVIVPLFSQRTAEIFARQAGPLDPTRISLVCMSRAVAEPLQDYQPDQLFFAKHPSRTGMIKAIADLISEN